MKPPTTIFLWLRLLWLLFLTASATSMTCWLFDRYGPPMAREQCAGLLIAAWAVVFSAFAQLRRVLPRRWLSHGILMLTVGEIVVVTTVYVNHFSCPPPRQIQQYNALRDAIYSNDQKTFQAVLAQNPQVDYIAPHGGKAEDDGWRLIDMAVEAENVPMAESLLHHGAAIHDDLYDEAQRQGNTPMMQMLTQHGARPQLHKDEGQEVLKQVESKE